MFGSRNLLMVPLALFMIGSFFNERAYIHDMMVNTNDLESRQQQLVNAVGEAADQTTTTTEDLAEKGHNKDEERMNIHSKPETHKYPADTNGDGPSAVEESHHDVSGKVDDVPDTSEENTRTKKKKTKRKNKTPTTKKKKEVPTDAYDENGDNPSTSTADTIQDGPIAQTTAIVDPQQNNHEVNETEDDNLTSKKEVYSGDASNVNTSTTAAIENSTDAEATNRSDLPENTHEAQEPEGTYSTAEAGMYPGAANNTDTIPANAKNDTAAETTTATEIQDDVDVPGMKERQVIHSTPDADVYRRNASNEDARPGAGMQNVTAAEASITIDLTGDTPNVEGPSDANSTVEVDMVAGDAHNANTSEAAAAQNETLAETSEVSEEPASKQEMTSTQRRRRKKRDKEKVVSEEIKDGAINNLPPFRLLKETDPQHYQSLIDANEVSMIPWKQVFSSNQTAKYAINYTQLDRVSIPLGNADVFVRELLPNARQPHYRGNQAGYKFFLLTNDTSVGCIFHKKQKDPNVFFKMYNDWAYAQYLTQKYPGMKQTLPSNSPPLYYNLSTPELVQEWINRGNGWFYKKVKPGRIMLAQKVDLIRHDQSMIYGCQDKKHATLIRQFMGLVGRSVHTLEEAINFLKNLQSDLPTAARIVSNEPCLQTDFQFFILNTGHIVFLDLDSCEYDEPAYWATTCHEFLGNESKGFLNKATGMVAKILKGKIPSMKKADIQRMLREPLGLPLEANDNGEEANDNGEEDINNEEEAIAKE